MSLETTSWQATVSCRGQSCCQGAFQAVRRTFRQRGARAQHDTMYLIFHTSGSAGSLDEQEQKSSTGDQSCGTKRHRLCLAWSNERTMFLENIALVEAEWTDVHTVR